MVVFVSFPYPLDFNVDYSEINQFGSYRGRAIIMLCSERIKFADGLWQALLLASVALTSLCQVGETQTIFSGKEVDEKGNHLSSLFYKC
jgi:hypothetical protein